MRKTPAKGVERRRHSQPELALWRAVLAQALVDAYKPSRAKWEGMDRSEMTAAHKRQQADREDAKKWLEGGGAEFQRVCTLADIDVEYIQDVVIPRHQSEGNG